jgi:triacylglycerol lipase
MIKDLTFNQQSLMFVNIAAGAYLDDCSGMFSNYKLTNYQHLSNDNANGHIAYNDDDLVISFRGTDPIHIYDWVEDINIWPEQWIIGRIHGGFKNEADKLITMIMSIVKSKLDREIWICGHSLGGAMASITATDLINSKICVPTVFTFGEPRSGSRKYVENFTYPHYRFVNCNDAVTALPPIWFGYIHHGKIIYISYEGTITGLTIWQIFSDQINARKKAYDKGQIFDSIYDHFIKQYVQKLSQFDSLNP